MELRMPDTLYIDATVPLRWGPHPVVGIPRVEFAIVRQALQQRRGHVSFFKVDRDGKSRLLDEVETDYLIKLVEGRVPAIGQRAGNGYWGRCQNVIQSIRSGASVSGKEFDRVSAAYISGCPDRRGLSYQASKALVRGIKLLVRSASTQAPAPHDPLAQAGAKCFLSTAGLHHLAASRRVESLKAEISTVLHDLIPIEQPHLTDQSHARNFARDIEWMFENCRQIICVSEHTAERARVRAMTLGGEKPPRIEVAQLGSFLKAAMETSEIEPVPELVDRRFVLYCSTIEVRKNHILLLKLWSTLLAESSQPLPQLVFCGRWGWMYEEVKAYLASHPGLDADLVILNEASDRQLAWLYRHAEFGLYPSLAEGWGLGAAESLDYELPIIVSDTPSLAEATQGLMPILPADDLDSWKRVVRRAVDDPSWSQVLRQRIRQQYHPIREGDFASRLFGLIEGAQSATPATEPSPKTEFLDTSHPAHLLRAEAVAA